MVFTTHQTYLCVMMKTKRIQFPTALTPRIRLVVAIISLLLIVIGALQSEPSAINTPIP